MERASSDDYDYSDSFINDEDSRVPSTDDDEISIKEMENGKGGRLRKKFEVSNSDSTEILARADESSYENYVEVLNNSEYKIPRVRFLKRRLLSRVMRSWKARRSTLENGEPNAKSEKTSEARTLDKRWNESSSDVLPSQNGDATLSNKKRTRDMIEETSDVLKIQLECSETKKQATDKNIEKEAATQKPLEIEKAKLDGESADKGKKVSMFDSNIGEAPLKFRLGGEEVLEGGPSIGVEDVINTNTNTEERLREDVPKNAWLGRQ